MPTTIPIPAGELYRPAAPALAALREEAKRQCHAFNASPGCDPDKLAALAQHLGACGHGCHLEPPFYADYLGNCFLGDQVYTNHNCVFLDCAPIRLGDAVKLGPNVQLYTATHPLDPATRRDGLELAQPITIGENAWLGGGCIVLPGVTIGADTVVGAGSVVTRDLPASVIAVGNPCRVLRPITETTN